VLRTVSAHQPHMYGREADVSRS